MKTALWNGKPKTASAKRSCSRIMRRSSKACWSLPRLLDIIKNFVCFSEETEGTAKILAAYHQYFAVRKAVDRTRQASETDGKGGVFWHTQGSGKSLSMVFYAHLLQQALASANHRCADRPKTIWTTSSSRNSASAAIFCGKHRCRRKAGRI